MRGVWRKELGLSVKAARRWLHTYGTGGKKGLVDKPAAASFDRFEFPCERTLLVFESEIAHLAEEGFADKAQSPVQTFNVR